MKYLSLFSGIGGFELGIQQAYESNNEHAPISEKPEQEERPQGRVGTSDKHDSQLHDRNRTAPLCVGYSEIDRYAIQIYQKHFPKHKNYGDVTNIIPNELPDFDLLVGGFPCQAFSIAGKRGGFDDTRGTLFFDIARILADKKPRDLLLENVKGLLSHDSGRTFQTIIGVLTDLGYFVEWQVLNSKNFGVPQNRERVFIRGHLGGVPGRKVFPIGETDSDTDEGGEKGQERYARTVDTQGGINGRGTTIKQLNNPTHSNDRIYGEDGISPSLNTMQGGRRQPKIADYRYDEGLRIRQEFKGQDHSKSALLIEGTRIRRLTPTECERLQGFPDGWTEYGSRKKGEEIVSKGKHIGKRGRVVSDEVAIEKISDSQRYKTLGNAITVPVIKAIIEKLTQPQ